MQEMILKSNESILLESCEGLLAGEEPFLIRFGTPGISRHACDRQEEMLWRSLKQHHGNPTAVYRRGSESRLVQIVPEVARPDSFGFDDQTITTTSRIFKVEKADLNGWLPKHGDTLEYDDGSGSKTYTVQKTSNAAGTFYQDVGNFGILIRIHVMEYRGF